MIVDHAVRFDLLTITKSATPDGERGTFSGYASVFGVTDLDGDQVMPGAFPDDIDPKTVKMLRQHKHADLIGVWKSIRSDSHGVFVKGELNLDVQLARETYSLMKQGALDQMSVGMKVPRTGIEEKEVDEDGPSGRRKRKVRQIKRADLYEISLVTIAANPSARITDVKSMPTAEEFRRMLIATGAGANVDNVEKDYRALLARMTPKDALAAQLRQAVIDGFAPAIEMFRRRP